MLAARTGLSPVMVGRADELARLRELATTTGEPAVALISGEAGIGKTRLVAELVATLSPALPVLAGQGSQTPLLLKGPFSHIMAEGSITLNSLSDKGLGLSPPGGRAWSRQPSTSGFPS